MQSPTGVLPLLELTSVDVSEFQSDVALGESAEKMKKNGQSVHLRGEEAPPFMR